MTIPDPWANHIDATEVAGVLFALDCAMAPNDCSADDRRDPVLREALVTKLRHELQHVPGLALTREQMARLFDIPHEACSRVLATLVNEGVISMRPDGRFVGHS
jgi:hypothetical protein